MTIAPVRRKIRRGVGESIERPDAAPKVKGEFQYGSDLRREGMLFGLSAAEAFFVKCDMENNPPEFRDLGRLYIDVGLAPVKPAEFVIFRLSQMAGGGA